MLTTAPQAAGVIHTDFEKDLFVPKLLLTKIVQYGSRSKEAGKFKVEGKENVVKDGDVMHFRFNV
jgi:ribosome-binding ATPase YchF (GTP1/OBG family)